MKVFAESVGTAPLWAIHGTMAAGILIVGSMWWYTHRFGPSVVIPGLKDRVEVTDHRNDGDYAKAIAERFVREYFVFSWHNYIVAKRRAAWWCNPGVGQFLLRNSLPREEYYRRLHLISSVVIEDSEVVWENPNNDRYAIELRLVKTEWMGHVKTETPLRGIVHLRPVLNEDLRRPFRQEVVSYDFEPIGEAETTTDESVLANTGATETILTHPATDEAARVETGSKSESSEDK
ncbi:MAG: hypothetical protein PF961_10555 [Planctomycetota bacterium]|nr:hypothetical protein [Planctomycetota bacterium]